MRLITRVTLWFLALLLGGTLAAILQDQRLERKYAAAQDEISMLRDSLARMTKSCLLLSPRAHPDAQELQAAARWAGVPVPLYMALIEVESGTSGRYDLRGRKGEYGRAQIRYEFWRHLSSECAGRGPESQRRCAAQILRLCYAKWPNWRTAVACYNRFNRPDTTGRYVEMVERAIGRMYFRSLEDIWE